ncbi:DUF992 domain-containing protein [Tardiphaga alba]|uniref:DUF992 domain-containing protein n=1 Tax=Tardiphaga alba TaxID=340268 RepID=A0ABX8ABZ3_9BRAD|nr:DUF992 domain-containing protein [Tardiphaga alba]QUS41188.1 DUF992 domain-containing protein [Tardiphaga alba]
MRLSKMFGLAAVTLAASVATANAQQPRQVQVGVLECRGGQNVGYVLGSNAHLNCVFQSAGGRAEGYVANIRRFGIDLGFTDNTTVQWAIYAPTTRVPRGGLAGQYGGVGTNASVGVGFGGNFLVGGPNNLYGLQPVSVQGQVGLNVASGIVQLDLESTGPLSGHRYKKQRRHRH